MPNNADSTRTSVNQQIPWRQARKIPFPYKADVLKDKQWINDRKELFDNNGKDWMIKLWNKFW